MRREKHRAMNDKIILLNILIKFIHAQCNDLHVVTPNWVIGFPKSKCTGSIIQQIKNVALRPDN